MAALGGVKASALVERVREAADMQATQGGSSGFVEDDEIKRRIDEAATDLYDKLVTNMGEDYFVTKTLRSTNEYTLYLDDDFYRLVSLHHAFSVGDVLRYEVVEPFQRGDATRLLNLPPVDSKQGPLFYRLCASRPRSGSPAVTTLVDCIEVYPPQIEGTDRDFLVHYIPRLQVYDEGDITDNDPIYPGINGWEEYVVLSVAIRLLAKEESDTSDLRAERDRIERRIEMLKSRRDVGRPAKIVRTRKRRGYG